VEVEAVDATTDSKCIRIAGVRDTRRAVDGTVGTAAEAEAAEAAEAAAAIPVMTEADVDTRVTTVERDVATLVRRRQSQNRLQWQQHQQPRQHRQQHRQRHQ
jgi:hypothetical protein